MSVDVDALAADLIREAGSLAVDAGFDTLIKTSISDVIVPVADHAETEAAAAAA